MSKDSKRENAEDTKCHIIKDDFLCFDMRNVIFVNPEKMQYICELFRGK